jgi:RHS repeat-associated protein
MASAIKDRMNDRTANNGLAGKGNVTAVLDSGGQVVAAYRYDEFGNLMASSGTLAQPYTFSTKRYLEGIGQYYYGYRNYSPSCGRWTTRDPLGEAGGINLYGFVGNDPVNLVDPWGLEKIYLSIRIYLTTYFQVFSIDNDTFPPEINDIGQFDIPNAPCIFTCYFSEEEWNTGRERGKSCEGVL